MQLSSLKTRGSNIQSALETPEVVTKYLQEEVARGRVVEITPEDAEVHTSPFEEAQTRQVETDPGPIIT